MASQSFIERLNEAQKLMSEEKYNEALILLSELKEIEQKGDYEYDLIHKLYQLISNCQSLYNQEVILNRLKAISSTEKRDQITFDELEQYLKRDDDLSISRITLQRELEILILRDLARFSIEHDTIIF